MLTLLLIYTVVGAIAGVLAGLLGIGGGLVIVPMLVYCYSSQGIDNTVIMQMALGSSMASIMFTSVSSFMAHSRRGAVDWPVVKRISLGVLVGTYAGSFFASKMSTGFLKGFFVLFLYFVAIQILFGKEPKASREFPGKAGMFGAGNVIGIVSSLVGIGGGTLTVPFLIWNNVGIHRAIGTSAAVGFPIAIAGTLGYLINGLGSAGLPPHAIGFIYLPALAGIVAASVLTAPLGVRLAHSLPVDRLKRVFAVLLIIVGTRMLMSIIL